MSPLQVYQEEHGRAYAISLVDDKNFARLSSAVMAQLSNTLSRDELNGAWRFLFELRRFSEISKEPTDPRGMPPTLDHRFDSRARDRSGKTPDKPQT